MRRIICALLAVSVLLSFAVPSFAVESEEPQFGSINVEYSDSYGSIEQLAVMVQDSHVYANADVLSDRLGYRFEQNDNVISIYSVSNIVNQATPLLAVHFRINSTDVSYNPLFGAEYKYTAPAPCVENDNGIWVPLTYTLVLLGGNSTLLEDTLLIQMPQDNVLSIAAMIAKNDTLLSFDWVDDFGYSETTTNITNGAGRIVTLFSGLLEFDGAAWLSLVDWDAFDRKFGKSLVTMLCSRSQDELDEDILQVEAMLDLLSDDGKLGEMLRNKQMRIDSDVTAWQTACENYLKLMEDGSGSPAKYNLLYRQCERAMDQQIQFAALGGEGMIQIQDALSSVTNALDIASIIGEAVSYMTDFRQMDEYLFAVLENYLNRRTETDYLPDATAQAMEHYLRVMDLGTLGYSAYSYIEENWLKCIVDESGLDALLGAPANALIFTWDIMSETIPFYSGGLDAVENREISNYAQKMQNDALENLNSLLSDLKYNTSELSAADCVQLSEYCYVYLKASYIARAMAIKSLENTSDEFRNKMKSRLDSETELNQKIAGYLSVLSSANADNECYILGFLAENNDEYLEDYSDDNLSDIIDVDTFDEGAKEFVPYEQTDDTGYEMREKTFEYRTSGGVLYYQNKVIYPYFHGNSAGTKALNAHYQGILDKCSAYPGDDIDADYKEILEWDSNPSLPYYDNVTVEVTYDQKGYISVFEVYTMWSGGMHPYSSEKAMIMRMEDAEELSYKDILKGTDAQRNKLVQHYIAEMFGDYDPPGEYYENPYALTDEGLCFYLWMGDAVPPEELTIPYTGNDTCIISAEELLRKLGYTDESVDIGVYLSNNSFSIRGKELADMFHNLSHSWDIYNNYANEDWSLVLSSYDDDEIFNVDWSTDAVSLYGLTVNSTYEEIKATLSENGFDFDEDSSRKTTKFFFSDKIRVIVGFNPRLYAVTDDSSVTWLEVSIMPD